MNLEHKLETICKNRMEVKYNNALVREQLQVAGIILIVSAIALALATLFEGATSELAVITGWSKSSIVIVATLIIQLTVVYGLSKMYRKNKVGTV
jgi:hypothetical protein